MAIPFERADIASINAHLPCCCPIPDCVFSYSEIEFRDGAKCLGGFAPYTLSYPGGDDPEPWPDAFDLKTVGELIPVYKTQETSLKHESNGELIQKAERYGAGDELVESFDYTARVAFEFTYSQKSEYQKKREDWPAGDWPYGACPPASDTFPGDVGGVGASIGAPDDGFVPVTIEWPDPRPDFPGAPDPEPGEETPKAGFFQILLDGLLYSSDDPQIEISLAEDDTSCHQVQIRHINGAPGSVSVGQWSSPCLFSVNDNPCCEAEEMDCDDFTTGNIQHSLGINTVQENGDSWETKWIHEGSPVEHEGKFYGCDGDELDELVDPTDLGIDERPALYQIFLSPSYIRTDTRTASTKTITRTWEVDEPNDVSPPDPTDHSWQYKEISESGTAVETDLVEKDDNQNTSGAADALFTLVQTEMGGWGDTYGWGLNQPDFPGSAGAASAWGYYPETDGSGTYNFNQIFAWAREIRVRWYVPDYYVGDAHRTRWKTAFFHERWEKWRTDYYTWAVAKYVFLHKPEPGDDDYPVLSDFEDNPDTPGVNEAQELLDALIAAIDAITDPGDPPEEPTALRPSIIEASEGVQDFEWIWERGQAESGPETIDDCDPTKLVRQPPPPEEPDPDDYEDPEAYDEAFEAYEAALAAYEAAAEADLEASRWRSPWFIHRPTILADWRGLPVPPDPLGPDPTEAEIAQHAEDEAVYSVRLSRYNAATRGHVRICDVRHNCGMTPMGAIESYDHSYPTTELPPLDPAEEDPTRWASWYQEFS